MGCGPALTGWTVGVAAVGSCQGVFGDKHGPVTNARCAFPELVGFRHSWRPYQARVLAEFDAHIADGHFHILAAPGSGKTVLGLEAVRRLGCPALILAPTRAVRDQWIQRFHESFLPAGAGGDWCSTELAEPGRLTVSTYQALHAICRRMPLRQLAARLGQAGVGTLVLDEAHHLRAAWWQCLHDLKRALAAPRIIALTATPPYDVPAIEWSRYVTLCGPVDAEVPVPELVLARNLCPHQDHVAFCTPAEDEQRLLAAFDRAIRRFVNDLALNRELVALLARHPVLQAPEDHVDEILERSDYYLSLVIYLTETAAETVRRLRRFLRVSKIALPRFHRGWAAVLLNGLLFGRDTRVSDPDGLLAGLTRELRRLGAIEQRQVDLRAPPRLRHQLEVSAAKCSIIADIIELESRANPSGLRAVILCDHIREAALPGPGDRQRLLLRLGVVPVFEHLRRLRLPEVRPAIVTGSLLVLPAGAERRLREDRASPDRGPGAWASEPLWQAPDFVRLRVPNGEGGRWLDAVTRLFTDGEINVLVGTASLLGEGWDAPALNTLVLATRIGASMSSNQMRGRAIRVQPGNPDKTANIWHLACLTEMDAGEDRDPEGLPAGADFEALTRRFRAFAGLAYDAPVIVSGIERLKLDPRRVRAADAGELTAAACRRALDRDGLRAAWTEALDLRGGPPKRMVIETLIPSERLIRRAVLDHWLRWESPWLRPFKAWALRRRLRRVARALLEVLAERQLLQLDRRIPEVDVRLGARHVLCRLPGVGSRDESFFSETLREVFDLMASPRYLLGRGNQYHAVPRGLGGNRERATRLQAAWRRHVGRADLFYTRSAEGKHRLLEARERYLASRHRAGSECRVRWD